MEWWQIVLVVGLLAAAAADASVLFVWKKASRRTKDLASRIGHLPWKSRVLLLKHLTTDPRLPLPVRLIPPLLVLYLALPIDIVPDFIPVLGQLDDIAVVIVAVMLLSKYVPLQIIESHISSLEPPA